MTHQSAFWREIVRNGFAVPANNSAAALAEELNAFVASPDPELRDDFAYTILAAWIQRGILPPAQLESLAGKWRTNLQDHIGESGTDSVFRRTFSALLLAEIVRRDSQEPFLGAEGFRSTLEAALAYLRDERDLRGYDEATGWAHATAHTADLLRACAGHRQFSAADQARVLAAVAERLASAGRVYTHGEQDRLSQVAAAIVQREDFDAAAFAAWTAQLGKGVASAFASHPVRSSALTTRENNLQVLRALFVRLSVAPASTRRDKAMQEVLAALSRRVP